MIEIRYTRPDHVDISGTVQDLQGVRAGILHFVAAADPTLYYSVVARTTGSPAPYSHWLAQLIVTLYEGPVRVSIIDETKLVISGALDTLDIFASFWDFAPTAISGMHTHHEYFEDNPWIARDSIPVVIGVK